MRLLPHRMALPHCFSVWWRIRRKSQYARCLMSQHCYRTIIANNYVASRSSGFKLAIVRRVHEYRPVYGSTWPIGVGSNPCLRFLLKMLTRLFITASFGHKMLRTHHPTFTTISVAEVASAHKSIESRLFVAMRAWLTFSHLIEIS